MENGVATDAVAGAREWLRQRDAYREQLQKELESAQARVREIEGLLSELGPAEPVLQPHLPQMPSRSVRRAPIPPIMPIDPKQASIPEVVAMVVRGSHGMTINEIVREVRATKPGAAPTVVYPAIYRMAKDGRLRKGGDRYFPSEREAATE
jgi:hypothetical protein